MPQNFLNLKSEVLQKSETESKEVIRRRAPKFLHSAICAAAITAVFIAVITVFAEFSPPLKDWLKTVFTHHWLGKSALSVIIFITITFFGYFFPLKTDVDTIRKRILLLFWVSLASSLIIIVFFGYEAFFAHA